MNPVLFPHVSVLEDVRTLIGQEGRENIQSVGYYQVLLSLCTLMGKRGLESFFQTRFIYSSPCVCLFVLFQQRKLLQGKWQEVLHVRDNVPKVQGKLKVLSGEEV